MNSELVIISVFIHLTPSNLLVGRRLLKAIFDLSRIRGDAKILTYHAESIEPRRMTSNSTENFGRRWSLSTFSTLV